MQDELSQLNEQMSKIFDELVLVKETLIRQEGNLSEHMRRTEAAEESIKILKEEVRPLNVFMIQAKAIGLFIVGVSTLVGIAVAFKELLFH